MKKLLLLFFSFLLGIIIFVWILKIVGWQEIKNAFLVFSGWQGGVIFGLTLLMMSVGMWKWREILKGEGIEIRFRGLINPYLAGFSVMFLAPILLWGGEFFRSYILKERNSVPWAKGMASVVIDRILEWTVNLSVIIVGGIFFLLSIGLPPLRLAVIFGTVFLIFLSGIFFFYFKCVKKESIASFFIKDDKNKIIEVEKEVFSFFKINKKAMWKAISLSVLRSGIMYGRVWFLILFLGKTVNAWAVLSILGFSYLAVMIPIPTALGSHEAIQTFAFGSLGLGVSAATAFTMIIRGAELIVALAGAAILFRLGIILIKAAFFKRLDNLVKNGDNVS